MPKLLVLADDLTGAIDTGVQMSALGIPVFVDLGGRMASSPRGTQALVVNTCQHYRRRTPSVRYGGAPCAGDVRAIPERFGPSRQSGAAGGDGCRGQALAFIPATPVGRSARAAAWTACRFPNRSLGATRLPRSAMTMSRKLSRSKALSPSFRRRMGLGWRRPYGSLTRGTTATWSARPPPSPGIRISGCSRAARALPATCGLIHMRRIPAGAARLRPVPDRIGRRQRDHLSQLARAPARKRNVGGRTFMPGFLRAPRGNRRCCGNSHPWTGRAGAIDAAKVVRRVAKNCNHRRFGPERKARARVPRIWARWQAPRCEPDGCDGRRIGGDTLFEFLLSSTAAASCRFARWWALSTPSASLKAGGMCRRQQIRQFQREDLMDPLLLSVAHGKENIMTIAALFPPW